MQAKRMLADLAVLSKAFLECLSVGGKVFGPDGPASALGDDLESDWSIAAARLQDGFRALMYVVLLTTLDRDAIEG